jgi:hypothetical protein
MNINRMKTNTNDLEAELHGGSSSKCPAPKASVLGIAIVRIKVRPIGIIADEFGFLPMNTPGTDWPILSPSPSPEARENEGNK